MNVKIAYHIMPWEIDYALLSFIQFKKSSYYLPKDVNVIIETALNLSSHIIDWEKSKLPKKFFIDKYNQISKLLVDYDHIKNTYIGDKLYGHLDSQRSCISEEIDYYMSVCPDMYFSEHLLFYLIESAKQIQNKYFVVTPWISKLWDHTWDEITNPEYSNIPYKEWNQVDIFKIRYDSKTKDRGRSLFPTNRSKWAGWFDLYNKAFYEELCPIQEDWSGYGPWDWYSLITTEEVKKKGVDFQQYLLKGETIFEYSTGVLLDGFSHYYKDYLSFNKIPNQREAFESKMQDYLNRNMEHLKRKNII